MPYRHRPLRHLLLRLHCVWLYNLFPAPRPGTTWWQAFKCRWGHRGTRSSSGWPTASVLLEHHITCLECGAHYDICRPNTPQYANCMPFEKPDYTRATSWDEHHLLHPIS